jgi:hypothetical protein
MGAIEKGPASRPFYIISLPDWPTYAQKLGPNFACVNGIFWGNARAICAKKKAAPKGAASLTGREVTRTVCAIAPNKTNRHTTPTALKYTLEGNG